MKTFPKKFFYILSCQQHQFLAEGRAVFISIKEEKEFTRLFSRPFIPSINNYLYTYKTLTVCMYLLRPSIVYR